jgi:hypothetical protein
MITNDIQELLDGALGDERMSELLHTLSVSPEKRAALRQHMALRGTMERDRTASGLAPSEDAAIWGSIASVIQAPAGMAGGAAVATRIPGWAMRTAAVLVVGVAGYLLGSNETTNIFRSGDSNPTVAMNAPATVGNVRTAPPAASANAPSESGAASVPSVAVPLPAAAETRSASTPSTSSFQSRSTVRHSATVPQNSADQKLLASNNNNDITNHGGRNGNTPPVTPVTVITQVGMMDNHSTTLAATAQTYDALVAQQNRPVTSKPLPQMPVLPLSMKQHSTSPIAPEVAAFYANGVEVAFGERVGTITPTPTGIEDADPEFSNRSLDFSYRLLDGQIGVGGRLTYGTFSSVSLEARPVSDIGIEMFSPVLKAKKGLSGEVFINYRVPLWGRLAIGAEASFTGSSTYQKVGGDLFLLYFVSDHIGIQAGGGYGQYWYNLRNQRDQIFRDNPNAAISYDALDNYQGAMVQGRYGLLYRF